MGVDGGRCISIRAREAYVVLRLGMEISGCLR
jgi:hypothetical protein